MKALHIIEHVCAVLVALGVPSIINGLLGYYKVSGEAQGVVSNILDFMSALARRDSPSTLKMPFTPSQAPTPTTVVVVNPNPVAQETK